MEEGRGEGVVQCEMALSYSILDKICGREFGPPLALMKRVWQFWLDFRL